MAARFGFTDEDMVVDRGLGYPRAYAKLCRDRGQSPYSHGPPFAFTPYSLQPQEALRAKELDEMFPIIDPQAKPINKAKLFVSLLWKQLNHLGNAGFDPAMFRVDQYGNVLYYHADSASPLAWDIDHWFPCSRGGLTVPRNLRILQWQVRKRKHNKLEILVPWWDLQLGISINQFLSLFAASNSDFRHRAFSWLFSEGEHEELNDSQTVDSHNFPQHFLESKEKIGLAPAAIVLTRNESSGMSSTLRSIDINRQPRPSTPIIASRKSNAVFKENENPGIVTNPYQAIVLARDSLRQREETAKMKAEIQKLDNEVDELKQKTEEEKVTIQDLERVLIKRKRRAEKCRRLAEAQSSYRTTLEKMIRDAMHQSVVYKEQVRLHQAAASALMATLEAQRAMCDSAEKELHKKYKQRDDLEKQVRPVCGQARKRSRLMADALYEETEFRELPASTTVKPKTPLHKQLRSLLEEEQKLSEAGFSLNEERKEEETEGQENHLVGGNGESPKKNEKPIFAIEYKCQTKDQVHDIEEATTYKVRFPVICEPEIEEDEESKKERGKGNLEKWLQILLENTEEEDNTNLEPAEEPEISKSDELIWKLNEKYPQKEIKVKSPESVNRFQPGEEENKGQRNYEKKFGKKKEKIIDIDASKPRSASTPRRPVLETSSHINEADSNGKRVETRKSFEVKERSEKGERDSNGLTRSESARAFRRIPSSPSIILGMKKGVDCMRKKPMVIDDDDSDEDHVVVGNNFLKSSLKSIRKAVKI